MTIEDGEVFLPVPWNYTRASRVYGLGGLRDIASSFRPFFLLFSFLFGSFFTLNQWQKVFRVDPKFSTFDRKSQLRLSGLVAFLLLGSAPNHISFISSWFNASLTEEERHTTPALTRSGSKFITSFLF